MLLCIVTTMSIANGSPTDPFPTIEIPVFYNGYQVKKVFNGSKEMISITYLVQTPHPPVEILEFYDAYFNANGWTPSFETCQRNWGDVTSENETAIPSAKLLFASWAHAQLNARVDLWIKYAKIVNRQHDEVTVKCLLRPKAD